MRKIIAFRLYADLKKEGPYEAVIDLHGVIRTSIITFLFKNSGTPSFSIDKGRKEKKFLIKSKYIRMLKHTLSLIHISEPTRRTPISYAVFCLKKKKNPSHLNQR